MPLICNNCQYERPNNYVGSDTQCPICHAVYDVEEIKKYSQPYTSRMVMGVTSIFSNDANGLELEERTGELVLVEKRGDTLTRKSIPFRDIISAEIFENGTSVTKTSRISQIGGGVIGGVAFGAAGAIIGGLSASKVTAGKVNRVDLRLIINDVSAPLFDVTFMAVEGKKGGFLHSLAMNRAMEWFGIIQVVIHQADAKGLNTPNDKTHSSPLTAGIAPSARETGADEAVEKTSTSSKPSSVTTPTLITEPRYKVSSQIIKTKKPTSWIATTALSIAFLFGNYIYNIGDEKEAEDQKRRQAAIAKLTQDTKQQQVERNPDAVDCINLSLYAKARGHDMFERAEIVADARKNGRCYDQ